MKKYKRILKRCLNQAAGCFVLIPLFTMSFVSCAQQSLHVRLPGEIKTGAELVQDYLPLIKDRNVALVCNHTSLIGGAHLADSLLSLGVSVKCVFAPEHGFRGEAAAGEKVSDSVDAKTKLRIISLYGKHLKPTKGDLTGIDVVVFDIQDVGVRFYTYISTLQYVMEACAEEGIELIVLDRPNPNGFYIDGPVLKKEYSSFIGMQPVPVVYGLTIGEYARMLNGERWLKDNKECNLKVIRMRDYSHSDLYSLPVKPSPNLPNMTAVYLYPSLCLFEGTRVSVGRGTQMPFQVIGFPGFKNADTNFTPHSIPASINPPYRDTLCNGISLEGFEDLYPKTYRKMYLYWLKAMYESYPEKEKFFTSFFEKLAGNSELRQQVQNGLSEEAIRSSWQSDIEKFKKIRKKYLLYTDVE